LQALPAPQWHRRCRECASGDGTFRIVAGEDRLRCWKPDGGSEKWFCGDCGSALFGRNPAHRYPIGIRMGTFDGDPGIRPSVRQFVSYAAPWEPVPDDGLPRYPRAGTPRGDPCPTSLLQPAVAVAQSRSGFGETDGRLGAAGDEPGGWGCCASEGAVSGPEGGDLVAVELGEVVTHRD
jgi:hypothetical protein